MFYLMVYDEARHRLVSLTSVGSSREAVAAHHAARAQAPASATVLLFYARDEAALRSTHSRYFEQPQRSPLATMWADQSRRAQELLGGPWARVHAWWVSRLSPVPFDASEGLTADSRPDTMSQ